MIERNMLKWLKSASLALIASFALADEPNAIKSIEVRADTANQQEVTISLQKAPQVPASFAVNTPPRIAFDFVNTTNESGKSTIPVSGGNLKSVSLAEAAGRTRVVLSLVQGASYETRVEGNQLKIVLSGGSGGAAKPVNNSTTQFSTAQNQRKESIRDVDFRRGTRGEGRVVVDLSSPTVGIDIRQQGKSLVLEFAKTSLPRQFERRMDVADFGTPVQSIDTYTQGDSIKMVIDPRGAWEYSAYQTENRFIVEVKNIDEQAKRLAQLDKPTYKGDKLSLNFQNVEVRTVLQVIAEFTGKNIITSDTVNGNLTLRLKDVPWDQALDLILQSKGLDKRENGNVMWVAPREEIALRETQLAEGKKKLAEVEPTRSESFQLNYQKAEDVRTMLMNDKQPFLSKQGTAIVEPRTNTLIVSDIPSKLDEVRALLQKTDIASRQVMIEARIVVADDTFSRDLGIKLGVATDKTMSKGSNTRVGFGGNTATSNAVLKGGVGNMITGGTSGSAPANNINLPADGSGAAAGFGITLLNAATGTLVNLELQALETEGRGRTVSSPRVITADQQKATISQGRKYYIIVPGGSGASAAPQEKEASLKLEVTPRITPDRRVFMELRVSNDVLTQAGQFPVVETKVVETNVLVGSGDTAVLGGVYELTEGDDSGKVPVLGDIPYLGNLFKSRSKSTTKKELLIFITPRILDDSLTLR
ncbi:type IV pilus secretin PilQ [Chitinimonas arctica]|uniref:Type IV pilus biogenesis and competence protein PilQ n=1 Tax=Chitinimonas arctica TaxID=2594795 RepID=A0A516SEN1_9NEIS|nr:type IV pilus secretin family protein [Chitinimonas arctica]QDQ26616.1 type IV pilus secretin PilQ [Chitinimonas arctica]